MSTLATDLRRRMRHPLPGFGLSLGLGMSWLALIVLLPLAALVVRAAGLGTEGWLRVLGDPRVRASLALSFGASTLAAVIACIAGAVVAWVDKNVDKHGTRKEAEAYLRFLYAPQGQRLAAKHFYRPAEPAGLAPAELARFPTVKQVTIDEAFGGWKKAQALHFADGGFFDQIYKPR